ncbi:unnamed protein product [Withania somnifera]
MVYTLGSVVNSVQSDFPALRLSTLVEHLDSLIRTHAPLMKDRRCGSFLCNYSKLTSSLARMTSSLTFTQQPSSNKPTPFLVSL